MILSQENIHIDLHLPRGWNQCTTEELETIAATIMRHTLLHDRYHPFEWTAVKTELFFALTETHPQPLPVSEGSGYSSDEGVFLCSFADRCPWLKKLFTPLHHREGQGGGSFRIETWQVHSWIDQHLSWLDDEKAQPLLIFPYKQLLWSWHWQWRWPFVKREYHAPAEFLQDFSWQEYRHLQDYMELYVKMQNAMLRMQQGVTDRDRLAQLEQQADDARQNFLKVLFRLDDITLSRHNDITKKIGPIQWQVILLWWTGFMHYLQQKFPRCFKSSGKQPLKKNQASTPLDLYVSITATMQKYLSLDEDRVNHQTFYLSLEQLERIAKENEEMEKISKKQKTNK